MRNDPKKGVRNKKDNSRKLKREEKPIGSFLENREFYFRVLEKVLQEKPGEKGGNGINLPGKFRQGPCPEEGEHCTGCVIS